MNYKWGILLLTILLISCSGEDVVNKDTVPPLKPVMVSHLGDSGDHLGGVVQNYYINSDLEYNGIDAVPGEDWIQVQWEHISDEDADYLEVHRFCMEEYNYFLENIEDLGEDHDFSQLIETLDSTEEDHYIDISGDLPGKAWFYYITVFDEAGNFTRSDTVSYNLADRAAPLSPLGGVYNNENLSFSWSIDSQYSPSQSRLLLFNTDRELLWVYTPLDFDGTEIDYFGPDLDTQTLLWRIDVFGDDLYYNVLGKEYLVKTGSESQEYIIFIQ